jgi:hypothetical protein
MKLTSNTDKRRWEILDGEPMVIVARLDWGHGYGALYCLIREYLTWEYVLPKLLFGGPVYEEEDEE